MNQASKQQLRQLVGNRKIGAGPLPQDGPFCIGCQSKLPFIPHKPFLYNSEDHDTLDTLLSAS